MYVAVVVLVGYDSEWNQRRGMLVSVNGVRYLSTAMSPASVWRPFFYYRKQNKLLSL